MLHKKTEKKHKRYILEQSTMEVFMVLQVQNSHFLSF